MRSLHDPISCCLRSTALADWHALAPGCPAQYTSRNILPVLASYLDKAHTPASPSVDVPPGEFDLCVVALVSM